MRHAILFALPYKRLRDTMDPYTERTNKAVPIAIVVGFAFVALAIYLTAGDRGAAPVITPEEATATNPALTGTPRPVDDTDYIRGNPNAQILMIEYSDYDCPFCKQYHDVMNQIMREYGVTGKVAWVYRQFPLAQLHPNAPKISEAALCVGKAGGDEAFWKFTDMVFQARGAEELTNMVQLPEYAAEAGVDRADFEECVDDGDMANEVKESAEEGFNIGARGTPYTVLVVGNEQAVINGAQSFETVKSIIDNLLKQLEGGVAPAATASSSN